MSQPSQFIAAVNLQISRQPGVYSTRVKTDGTAVLEPGVGGLAGSVSVSAGSTASNTTQAFTCTLSAPVPAGSVVVWSLAEGSGPISGTAGIVLQMESLIGAVVTMSLNNSWNSTQGWNDFTVNFKVV